MATWNQLLLDTDQYVWEGAWTTATGYSVNDCVENDGSGYVCISAHTSGDTDDEPGTGATWETYWDLLVQGVTAASVDDVGAVMEADFDAQTVLAATANDTPVALTVAEQEVVGRLTGGNVDGVTIGIADNNIVQVDGTPVDTEVAVWTAAGLDSKSYAELLALLSGDAGAAFDWNDQILQKVKGYLLTPATELTLDAAGAITVTQMVHTVDTLGDAASDLLVTINGGTTVGLLILRPAHTDRSIVLDTGADNIVLQGGSDITLDDITDHIMLFWDTTNSKWVDFGGGGGGSGDVATDAIWDAKGDLAVGTGANTAAKLAIGSDEQVAVVATDTPGWAWPKKMRDADGDTLIQVEEGADEDKIRMDVAGTEAFLLSNIGVLTLAKQSTCYNTEATAKSIVRITWTKIDLADETYDVQNEFNTTTHKFTAIEAGKYFVKYGSHIIYATDGNLCYAATYKNGVNLNAHKVVCPLTGTNMYATATFVADLAAGDYLELYVHHNYASGNRDANYSLLNVSKML